LKIWPGATVLSARAFNSITPRRVVTRICSPATMPVYAWFTPKALLEQG
jgi:hypothetical protein